MGSTEKKAAANRSNAKQSTGPKSKLGKLKSSKNAVKHGVYSVECLLWGEDEELHRKIKREQQSRFSPKTYVDKALVSQLVAELWNLRRVARAEFLLAQDIQERLKIPPSKLAPDEQKLLGQINASPNNVAIKLARAKLENAKYAGENAAVDEFTTKKLQTFERLKVNLARIDGVYSQMFLFESQERTQKLTMLKRQCLHTILGIERELERRGLGSEDGNVR